MNAHRLETIVDQDGTLTLENLPFKAGDAVEVIVLERASNNGHASSNPYPLRGTPLIYDKPFDTVAEEDWSASR